MTSNVLALVVVVAATVAVEGITFWSLPNMYEYTREGVVPTNKFLKYYNNCYKYKDEYMNMYAEDAVLYPAGHEAVQGRDAIAAFRANHDKDRKLTIDVTDIKYKETRYGFTVRGYYETSGEGGVEKGTFVNVYKANLDDEDYYIEYSMYNIYQPAKYYTDDAKYLGVVETNANYAYEMQAPAEDKYSSEYKSEEYKYKSKEYKSDEYKYESDDPKYIEN